MKMEPDDGIISAVLDFNNRFISTIEDGDDYNTGCEDSSDEDISVRVSLNDPNGGQVPGPSNVARVWNSQTQGNASDRFTIAELTGPPVQNKFDHIVHFEALFPDDLFFLMAEQTNLYAKQFIETSKQKPRSRSKKWVDTNKEEMKVFTALLILQGIIKKPSYALYFSKRESLETPFFHKTMTEERFHLLAKFIHFADNSKYNAHIDNRKLYKILPILTRVRAACQANFVPQQTTSLDESLPLWKGRLSWKQCIPSKKSRFGMKLFELCDSSSGYVWNFVIYTGKDTDFGSNCPEQNKITSQIVLELAQDLFNNGYILYLDNWYTSIESAEQLCDKKTDVIGAVRKSPEIIKNDKVKKGEYIARYNGKIMLLKWKDKKEAFTRATAHDQTMSEAQKRGELIFKPDTLQYYNKNVGGVDMSDITMEAYNVAREGVKKYYYKLFLHLLDIVCLNAHILYKNQGGKQNHLQFLTQLCEDIIAQNSQGVIGKKAYCSKGRPSLNGTPSRFTERHFPDKLPRAEGKKQISRRCKLCWEGGVRKDSSYYCKDCNVTLCVVPCFRLHHTRK